MAERTARPPGRLPGYVNIAGALALVLVVAVLALRVASVAPPAIAEFAPQAQQVKAAPPEQTSAVGNGAGGAAVASTPSPSPSPAAGALPAGATFLHCIGDPPRQIEDPQSPPCVPYWAGNNGGATAKGVSPTAVTVYWVYQGSSPEDPIQKAAVQGFQRFFNSRFAFYNRGLNLQMVDGPNGDVASQQSVAATVEQGGAFASTEYTNQGGLAYNIDLASHHVISITGFESNPSEAQLATYAPYLWSYTMSADRMFSSLGRWYCTELNGHPAAHAGAPLNTQPRKLAIVYDPGDAGWGTNLEPLKSELASCGVQPMEIDDVNHTNASTAVAQMSSHGITSAICVCWYVNWAANYTYAAYQASYDPEWILFSYGGGDTQEANRNGGPPPSEAATTFGLSFQPRQEKLQDDPTWWAWSEGAPGAQGPTSVGEYYQMRLAYRSLLEIASGIQMAGPNLTPQTFQSGLQRAAFPNPVTSIHAGAVDFFGGSHSMTVDAAQWWWSNTGNSPWVAEGDTALGAICYVEGGRRYQLGDWHAGMPDELMQPPCDSGA